MSITYKLYVEHACKQAG